jgi:hypothetical protein
MTPSRRAVIAVGLMSVGLVLLLVSGLDEGWTLLTGVGVGCLVVAIGAELLALRRPGQTA